MHRAYIGMMNLGLTQVVEEGNKTKIDLEIMNIKKYHI